MFHINENSVSGEGMKKLLFILLIITFSLSLNSLGKLRVESIKLLPETHMNIEKRDADGKWAPVLIVKTELRGLGFRNVSQPTKHAATYDEGKHQYTFYMNDNQRVIEITHSDYEALEVRLLADFGIEVNAQRVYEMKLTNVPEKVFINVVIISQPADAEKIVDGENLGTGQSFRITTGEHTIDIEKMGYESKRNEVIIVSEEDNYFTFIMIKAENVPVIIHTEPSGARIFIDDIELVGAIGQGFFKAGKHRIKITKDKYVVYEDYIEITSPKTEKNYTLQPDFGKIIIKAEPEVNMNFSLNNKYSETTPSMLDSIPAIEYELKAEHPQKLYILEHFSFSLARGEIKEIILKPKINFGSIEISCDHEVNMDIFIDDDYQGKTPITLKPILEGKHTIKAKHKFYLSDPITISLKADEEVKRTIIAKHNFGTLTIKTSEGTKIYFNDDLLTRYENIKLNPQTVYLRAEKNKCETAESQFILKVGDKIIEELFPKSITGTILVTANPKDSEIELLGDAGEYFSGKGIESFNDIPFGNYSLKVTKENYISHEEKINLKKDEQIRREIELKKVNYVFVFSVSSGYYEIEDLNFKITRNRKIVYLGRGKKQISFSEEGTYKIEITKGKDFGFLKSINCVESRTFYINVVNHIEIAKAKKQRENEEFATKIYRSFLGGKPTFAESIFELFSDYSDFRFKPMIYSYNKRAALQIPFLIKIQGFFSEFEREKIVSFVFGISFFGNMAVSPEFFFADFFSINTGFVLRSYNHKNRIIFDLDGGLKWIWGYNLNYNKERISFVRKIKIEDNKLKIGKATFGGWMPVDLSVSFERYIGGISFFVLRAGFWWFSTVGPSSNGEWYYKGEIETWCSVNPLPQPIDGEPNHPIYQGFVPYIGVGIRF